jgi:hypothetical protein
VRDFTKHLDPSLELFEVAYFQARRADKSNAGGVSHRQKMCRASSPDETRNFKTDASGWKRRNLFRDCS